MVSSEELASQEAEDEQISSEEPESSDYGTMPPPGMYIYNFIVPLGHSIVETMIEYHRTFFVVLRHTYLIFMRLRNVDILG